MTSSKTCYANYDQFAPKFAMACKTIQPVFVPNLNFVLVLACCCFAACSAVNGKPLRRRVNENRVTDQRSWRIFYYVIWENGLVGTLLSTNMAAVIYMYGDFMNFEQLQLLHFLVYRPETCGDLSKQGYSHCVKLL